jgi:plastocyanin
VQLIKRLMPFLIGGLVGAVITVGLLVFLDDSNSPSASSSDHASGAEDHAHQHAEEADLGPAVDLTGQPKVQINIKDYAYARPNIRVTKGTKVTWTNQDPIAHNVMKEHDDGDHAHEAPSADEVRDDVFAGPLLAKGEHYSFVFEEVGSYPYHCAPHPDMQAVVFVTE